MELFPTRGYYFCRYCGAFHFPETTAADGIRVLGQSSTRLDCPVCARPLSAALLDEKHPVSYCGNCRGVLLPRTSFAEVVRARRAWATGAPAAPVPLARQELERKVSCPLCRDRMQTHPYYGPGNIVMDSCATCDAVWLDFGELKQIVDAPGSDRGTREVVPRSTGSSPPAAGFGRPVPWEPETDLLSAIARLFR